MSKDQAEVRPPGIDVPEELLTKYLNMRGHQKELSGLRGDYASVSVTLEALIREIVIVYLDIAPDRQEQLIEMFLSRATLGTLADDLRIVLKDPALAEFADVAAMVGQALNARNQFVHDEIWFDLHEMDKQQLSKFKIGRGSRQVEMTPDAARKALETAGAAPADYAHRPGGPRSLERSPPWRRSG